MKKKSKPAAKKSRLILKLFLTILVLAGVGLVYLDARVRYSFDEKRWQLPARVYARPLVLDANTRLNADDLAYELRLLGYRSGRSAREPGSVSRYGEKFEISTRGNDTHKSIRFRVEFDGYRIDSLKRVGGQSLKQVALEPMEIGSIYPGHREDRILLQLQEVPNSLIETLLLIEDRDFHSHFGLSPKAIARAGLANLKAGRTVQGGSTLTQQLVKNAFLNRDRSLLRKGLEATMALLVEFHYSKAEILETYLNEIYLGQEGARAIHGFALASRHYFNRPLHELGPGQIALLVGMVKGPSYYDPWRHSERAKQRRNVVLQVMADHQLISKAQAIAYANQSLQLAKASALDGVYPAYLDLVRRQLRRDYSREELQTQGLHIHTAFDPIVQLHAERSLKRATNGLDKTVEAAVVVTDIESAEVVAVLGGRQPRFAGFNRALDAIRPIGSLIKPAVFLTALEQPDNYSLASIISDGPVQVAGHDGSVWQPRNFDRKSHGDVMLHQALVNSYNQATSRLGMQLGLDAVEDVVQRLGVKRPQPKVPAMLLGAGALSPLEVSGMYQTIAAGGEQSALRAITTISNKQGKPLVRYSKSSRQKFDRHSVHLLQYAMVDVMQQGTGKTAYQVLPRTFTVAGKTGTTNDSRDSWFAGFAGDYLAVVWLGRDDNGPTRLTGSSGALKVWRELFAAISHQPLSMQQPDQVAYYWVDHQSGVLSGQRCPGAMELPFIEGSEPSEHGECVDVIPKTWRWLRGLFGRG
jgi:penicillin-binding protein 1B